MIPGYQILHLILSIFLLVIFLNAKLFVADSSVNSLEFSAAPNVQQLYRMDNNEERKEWEIKKVSGEDENAEKRSLFVKKLRLLLGLGRLNLRSRRGHSNHGFLSPSPAPYNEAPSPAPVPAHPPVVRTRLHAHRRPHLSKLSPPPLQHEFQQGHPNKDRHRSILIAVAVSSGAAFVIIALGLTLLCWNFRRNWRRRSMVKISVYHTDSECRRSKYVTSSHSKSKVSFDLVPDHFYLNSLEQNGSSLKNIPENVNNISSKQNQTIPSVDQMRECGNESIPSQPDNVNWSLVEETRPVQKCEEQDIGEIDGLEHDFSNDESFHSVCDSCSSEAPTSDASDRELNNSREFCSTLNYTNISSPKYCVNPLNRSPREKTPTQVVTPNLNPCLHSSCKTSHSDMFNPTQRIFMSSPVSQLHIPSPPSLPPPPPPPPPIQFFSSKPRPVKILPTASSTTISNISSPHSTDSSGLRATQQEEVPHLPQTKSRQASASTPQYPSPPCPPMPPPAPPQSFNRHGNAIKHPPPPPGQSPQFMPVGKDGTPLTKLKPLHWDKVRATPDRSMIWDNMRSSSFEFDEKMIQTLFGYHMQLKKDEAMSKSPSPTKHVLEPKRLQNLTILSKAINATSKQVCDALMQGKGLCLQQLEALVKMVPTKEEESKLLNYQGNINELDSAEKFLMAMLNVPFAFTRIEAMLYRDTFEDEVIHLRKSFTMLEEACKELTSSRLFLKLLEAVLKTGNRMNVGTIRGGARAFKLDALLKLADIKGTDGRTTLLHFVVQEMIRSEGIRESEIITKKNILKIKDKTPEERDENYRRLGLDLVSSLCTELCNVKKTATVDLDVIAGSVSNLSDGMLKLQHLVQDDLAIEQNNHFVHSMRTFLNYAQEKINELKKDEDRVLLHVKEITEYFHGHVSKYEVNPLRIFVIVRDFLGMLDQVCKEVKSLKITHNPNSVALFR